jgi:hypothetical protein
MSVMVTVALASTASIQEVVVWPVVNIITEPTLINVCFLSPPSIRDQELTSIDHPGYFGKVGMRYFHERKVSIP